VRQNCNSIFQDGIRAKSSINVTPLDMRLLVQRDVAQFFLRKSAARASFAKQDESGTGRQ
jgi:hypothetical protein